MRGDTKYCKARRVLRSIKITNPECRHKAFRVMQHIWLNYGLAPERVGKEIVGYFSESKGMYLVYTRDNKLLFIKVNMCDLSSIYSVYDTNNREYDMCDAEIKGLDFSECMCNIGVSEIE